MVSSVTQPIPKNPEPARQTEQQAEQRVVFHDLSWENYQQILAALGNKRSSRLTYDRGTLEITRPLEEHENAVRMIEVFIRILVTELGMKIKTMGSTTLNRPDLQRSAEADDCYYIQNQPKVVGKIVDLTVDPPPDLIAEIDITHTDIDKLKLYAAMGVPEFWRYNGKVLRIYQLQQNQDQNQYLEVEDSPTFPLAIKERLYQFLEECWTDEVEAENSFRAWVKQQRQN
jgi:Uma2 family endonuclease